VSLNTGSRISTGPSLEAEVISLDGQPGGNINIQTRTLTLSDRSEINADTLAIGDAGNITIQAQAVTLMGSSSISSGVNADAMGQGGSIDLQTHLLDLDDGSTISTESFTGDRAGNITLTVVDRFQLTNSAILTDAQDSSGGDIRVNTAENSSSGIIILDNGDITTNSSGNGGDINLQGAGIIALNDSDILARSQDARGGNIALTSFFSDTIPLDTSSLNRDGQVDVNADGRIASGSITQPDTSSIQNSLNNLAADIPNTDRLLTNTCINRDRQQGQFTVTGSGNLPQHPGTATTAYPTGAIAATSSDRASEADRPWQMGDAIVEPQGVVRLSDGRLVMSYECSQAGD
jgi:large exoprotein involved in heme utilization and adhesion